MIQGSLIALAAVDAPLIDIQKHFTPTYVMDILTKKGDNLYETTISPGGFTAEYIDFVGLTVIRKNADDTTINIKDIEFRIGTKTIVQIPYRLLEALFTVKHIGNKTIFKGDFSMFLAKIPVIRLVFEHMQVLVHVGDSSNIDKIILPLCCTYLDSDARKEVALKEQSVSTLQCIEEIELSNCIPNTEHNVGGFKYDAAVDFKGRSKGFFVCGDIDNIVAFKVYVGFYVPTEDVVREGHYMLLEKTMIEHIGVRVSDKVLYIPINAEMDFKKNSTASYQGSLGFSSLDRSRIEIIMSEKVDSIHVYSLAYNKLVIKSGMSTIVHKKKAEKIHDDYNDGNRWTRVDEVADISGIMGGQVYYKCYACNKSMTTNVIEHFNDVKARTCPDCSCEWTNWNMYINRQPRTPVEVEERAVKALETAAKDTEKQNSDRSPEEAVRLKDETNKKLEESAQKYSVAVVNM
jgi:hypothetical protein